MSDSLGRQASRSETVMLMQQGQENFLRNGGIFGPILTRMYANGQLQPPGEYHEYPKMVRVHRGRETVSCSTENVKGKVIEWSEEREIFEEVIVNSEAEEERVLMGGKSASQIEEDRQGLLLQAKQRGLKYDPSWSLLRLQRELGIRIEADEPPAVFDEVDDLRRQVARAEEALALRKQLAALQAELAEPAPRPDDVEDMRSQLRALGVKVDGRWNPARLRAELEEATAPRQDDAA